MEARYPSSGWKMNLMMPPINEKIKLNFDRSKIENKNAFKQVIKDSNGIIKTFTSKHTSNASIFVVECMILSDDVLITGNNKFLNIETKCN